MEIKLEELKAIEKALHLLPQGELYNMMPDEIRYIISKADVAVVNCYKRNIKTAS